MAIAGRAENLARGESLKSTTYEVSDGKVYCYLVTYRNTDPLFRINVTDPDDMYEEGQLKVPGYSSYLYSYDKITSSVSATEERTPRQIRES